MHVELHCNNTWLLCGAQMNYLECHQSYFPYINNAKDFTFVMSCAKCNDNTSLLDWVFHYLLKFIKLKYKSQTE